MALQSADAQEVVRSYLKSDDFEIISCEGSGTDGVSTGFLSAQNKAKIKFRSSRGDGELNVFTKFLPKAAYHRQNVLTLGGFEREVVLFNELLDKYHDFLQDDTIPKCYLARSDLIVMEDVSKKGFKNKPLYDTLDLHHCEKTIEALAKFHALSFITEKREGRKMCEIVPVINTEVFMSKEENHVGRRACLASIRCVKRVIEKYVEDLPLEVMKKSFLYMDNLFDQLESSKLYPNVLTHYDLWTNNIMFKYDEQGNVLKSCLVDFQLSTYKAPGYDLQFFLHACTEAGMRERNLDHFNKLYYGVLARTLKTAGIDVEDIMGWQDFEGMLKETLPAALAQVCNCLVYVLVPQSILNDVMENDEKFKEYYEVDRTEHVLQAMATDKDYNIRFMEAVTSYVKYFKNDT